MNVCVYVPVRVRHQPIEREIAATSAVAATLVAIKRRLSSNSERVRAREKERDRQADTNIEINCNTPYILHVTVGTYYALLPFSN